MMAKRKKGLLLLVLSVFTLSFPNKEALAQPTLKIGAIPDQNPEHLNRLYKLLSNELSKELKVPVRYIPVISYPAAVSAFRTGSLDLVWFGGLTGVQARAQKPNAKVIAQRDVDARFHSVFIANKSSGIPVLRNKHGLTTLKGKRFTFGSASSTSGRLMPQHFLQQAGIETTDFKGGQAGFSGSHYATIALVSSGSYDAGALNAIVWAENLKSKRLNLSNVKVIWKTPAYVDYHWLAQPNLDKTFGQGFTNKIRDTLLGFSNKSKSQAKILELFGAKNFIPAKASQYNDIERIGRQLGKVR